jgi:hypothetical protein
VESGAIMAHKVEMIVFVVWLFFIAGFLIGKLILSFFIER